MRGTIAYHEVDIPSGKDPADYSYAERRAELLERIEQHGHPWGINETPLPVRYGCAPAIILTDLHALREYLGLDPIDTEGW